MDQLEDELVREIDKLTHEWHCAVARNMWDEKGDDFEFHRVEASKTYKAIGRLSLPWYNTWGAEATLKEMWDQFREAGKDPEYRKWRDQRKKTMRDRRAGAEAEAATMAAIAVAKQAAHKERSNNARLRNESARRR
jgi:hypothetical protein